MSFLTKLFLTLVLLLSLSNITYGIEIVSRKDSNIEESLSEESNVYSAPQKIYVSQIEGYNSDLSNDSKEWLQLLYYYSITRLKLNDIPYNYLIDKNGKIYEGTKGGVGVNPGLEGGENIVLIGILDNNSVLSLRTQTSLKELVEDLSYTYGIKSGSWDIVDLKISKNENSLSYLVSTKSNKAVKESISKVLNTVKWSDQEHLVYKASIQSVEYSKEVVIGSKLNVKVKIKNENEFPWFTSPNYIYISTKDSVDSIHAINLVWESFSKPTHIQQNIVKVGETVEVTFDMLAKSKPSEYKENFLLMKSPTLILENSNFEVTFNIVKGDNKVIQVSSPEYGFVNIRDCRWYSCEKVEVANEGDVFITTRKEEGWYEIIYGDNKRGWVYQKYAKEL